MLFQGRYTFLLMGFLAWLSPAQGASSWYLELPESAVVQGSSVTIADLAATPVPAAVGDLVLLGKSKPGTMTTVSRQIILRKLVEAGLAGGVIFRGSTAVQVNFEGIEISSETLREEIRGKIQPLVPVGKAGAPASWFELIIPDKNLSLMGKAEITVKRHNPLKSGRNQIQIHLDDGRHHFQLPVTVILHCFGEIPSARMAIQREAPLTEDQFNWIWLDLAEIQGRLVNSREALVGSCAGRSIPAGDQLRLNDLKAIPAIRAGDMVDLQIERGGLVVTVKALARQAGCLGQTIPVRNELNGRLVNARVAGPGIVEWRR